MTQSHTYIDTCMHIYLSIYLSIYLYLSLSTYIYIYIHIQYVSGRRQQMKQSRVCRAFAGCSETQRLDIRDYRFEIRRSRLCLSYSIILYNIRKLLYIYIYIYMYIFTLSYYINIKLHHIILVQSNYICFAISLSYHCNLL